MQDFPGISIRNTIKPGDIGNIISLHGVLYESEYGYDKSFEIYVAIPLAEFANSFEENIREKIWIIESKGDLVGSMAIVEHSKEDAQLRWLLLHPVIRGLGLGKMLMDSAISFCRSCGYSKMFLWTEDLLLPAINLYKSKGFKLTHEKTHPIWGSELTEQRYELKL